MKFLQNLAVGVFLLLPTLVLGGGNLLQGDPANLSNVLETKWDSRMMPLAWVLSSDGIPGSAISTQQLANEFTAAFSQWQELTTTDLNFVFEGLVDRRSGRLGGPLNAGVDGYNLVTFTDPDFVFPPGVLAVSLTTSFAAGVTITAANSDLNGDGQPDLPEGVYPPGTIFDGDIIFNGSLPFQFSGNNNTMDIRAVALHEIGHHIGLSHSSIPDAVMWPFLSNDITSARTLKLDDIAYASSFYPDAVNYPASYGTIEGSVLNGSTNVRVLGAHVYALDVNTGQKLVGAYTLNNGGYKMPVPAGNYFIGIEPLDGDPTALDPKRINSIIAYTFDTAFPEELYDSNESNIEADPTAAQTVSLLAGANSTNINLITNTIEVPGVSRVLLPGFNLFAYPVTVPTGMQAYDLLQALGSATEITSIDRFNPATGTFERASYVDGNPAGVNFGITRGEGYIVHSLMQKTLGFTGNSNCPNLNLGTGLNLIGVPCPPAGYSAFDLLQSLGQEFEVASVKRFNPDTQSYEVASYQGSVPAGTDFPIANGEGYLAEMFVNKDNVRVPGSSQVFPPYITGISPGRAVAGAIIIIMGSGFDPDVANNLINFNGVGTQVLYATPNVLTARVPYGATSGPVSVTTNGRESNSVNFIIEAGSVNEADLINGEIVSGQQVNGQISQEGEQDRYNFIGLQGSRVTIEARAANPGVPDLLLLLESPSGVALVTDDDSAGGTDPVIRNFQLPESGVYTIVVTGVPGTGTGPYTLKLDIATSTTAPSITILEGQGQSALAGNQLPIPFKILVSGPTGSPISNVPVNLVAQSVNVSPTASSSNPADVLRIAGSTSVSTNGNGIALVSGTLPNEEGTYEIAITIPGFPPTTITVAALRTRVSTIEITGNDQNCGGDGCPVNELLQQPYSIKYLDAVGNPVPGVLTWWRVVAGGGSLENFEPAVTRDNLQATIDSSDPAIPLAGVTRVKHKLGTKLYLDNNVPVKIPQLVAATVHGRATPVLFGATAKAGAPSKLESNITNFKRMTVNTGILNGVQVTVTDQFDNPVQNATIQPGASSGVTVAPGLKDGQILNTWQTDAKGQWVGAVYATNVTPTIDEFGAKGTNGLASSHNFSVSVQNSSASPANYVIDVDMGPSMVSVGQGSSRLITKDINNVGKLVLRYQRQDTYIDVGGGTDDDAGNWTDETSFSNIVFKPVPNIPINATVKREDGKDEEAHSLRTSKFNGQKTLTLTTDTGGYALGAFTMGDVGGAINLDGTIATIPVEFKHDLNSSRGQDGALITTMPFTDENNFREILAVKAQPFVVTINLSDPSPAEPSPDPYPGVGSASGIKLANLSVNLNPQSINFGLFNGPAGFSFTLNEFPYYRKLILDGAEQALWPPSELLVNSAFREVKVIFEAAGSHLEPSNTIQITNLNDNAGYNQTPEPASHPFSFQFP